MYCIIVVCLYALCLVCAQGFDLAVSKNCISLKPILPITCYPTQQMPSKRSVRIQQRQVRMEVVPEQPPVVPAAEQPPVVPAAPRGRGNVRGRGHGAVRGRGQGRGRGHGRGAEAVPQAEIP